MNSSVRTGERIDVSHGSVGIIRRRILCDSHGQRLDDGAIYLRAEAAAVSAIASGSQHSTMASISQRIACSVVPPSSCATYIIGAASTAT